METLIVDIEYFRKISIPILLLQLTIGFCTNTQ